MGRGPARPRTPMQSIGAIGSTTLAPAPNGGGHDALIRRLLGAGGTEWQNPRNGKVHAWISDPVPITGAGSFTINEFIVDDKWDTGQPCHVTVTAAFAGGYAPVQATVAPDPVTWYRPPIMTLSIMDGSPGRVTTVTADFEGAERTWPIAELYANAAHVHSTESVPWLYMGGRPKLQVECYVDPAGASGLYGSPFIIAIARITPL